MTVQASLRRMVFNGETGYVTVAEGTGARTVAVLDEGLWAQLVGQASGAHEEESP